MSRISSLLLLILILLFGLTSTLSATPPQLSQSANVSLLTCSPSDDAIYALFGHSGLRIKDDSLSIDVVFDYGVFDFSSDSFIFRFVKGETDYMVGYRTFRQFLFEYEYRSMGVIEQVFNITQAEKQQVFEALIENSLPENRVYRYNFFYDNCATRPRDIIANNIDRAIQYTPFTEEQTYRDLLDECLVLTPWYRFGINIVIGSGADKVITERQKDFIPLYVSTALGKALLANGSTSQPLVLSTQELLASTDRSLALLEAKRTGLRATNSPLIVGLVVLALAILVSFLSYYKRRTVLGKIFDTILFAVAGIAGSIIFFLMFFSEHPCVDANWNLVWLNPLALIFVLFFFVKSLTKYVISYHFVNFVALTLFLVGFAFLPQVLEVAFIPYILALWLRSGINVLCSIRKDKHLIKRA